ncbi:MAG: Thioredoxin family protein [uncultured Sulfurovum sp.]|uniref:Thioredoxin family protein n=1 Tax=uncultured Sulfurovum sp. TaxID=269237 RepID=A0A6S6SP30_9BACT|nr:MAG: Thioredoxin family protein [uncultured Sulfurovum sp.]
MKKIVLAIFVLSSMLFSLDWEKDIATAFTKAQSENTLVMVMVESEYCGWCSKMKERTLLDERITKRIEKYALVKVMRSDKSEMSKLPKVHGAPTVFFMKSDKTVVEEVIGYFNVEDFNAYLNDVERKSK